jgi:hypothetical protein
VQQYVKGERSGDSYGFSSSEVPKANEPKKPEKIESEKSEPEILETPWMPEEPLTTEEPSRPGPEHPQFTQTQAPVSIEQTQNLGEHAYDQGGQMHDQRGDHTSEERAFSPPIQDWDPAR